MQASRQLKASFQTVSTLFLIFIVISCSLQGCIKQQGEEKVQKEIRLNKRSDGTLSSRNELNANGLLDGLRITYYEDGKSIYSREMYENGIRQGPAKWYHKNGKLSLHLNYLDGKCEGPSKRYYMGGELMAEQIYSNDNPLPGLKEYDYEGNLVSGYPEVSIRLNKSTGSISQVIVELSCSKLSNKVKFYILEGEKTYSKRIYLISEEGKAIHRIYMKEGELINKDLYYLVEIPTDLGNTLVREYRFHLDTNQDLLKE